MPLAIIAGLVFLALEVSALAWLFDWFFTGTASYMVVSSVIVLAMGATLAVWRACSLPLPRSRQCVPAPDPQSSGAHHRLWRAAPLRWHPRLVSPPGAWTKVGELHMSVTHVTAAHPMVAVYATAVGDKAEIAAALNALRPGSPSGVRVLVEAP